MVVKNWFKKITGIQKLEDQKKEAEIALAKAQEEAEKAKREEELAKMTPKDRATAKGESWVGVLDTKVNPDNIRNGFFELDWNDEFILQLKQAGYGFDGDPEEEIVDRWFRDLARGVLAEEGMDPNRGMGYVNTRNINRLGNGKAEVE
jgi:hypothetical protein